MDLKQLNKQFDAMYMEITKDMDLTKPQMKKFAVELKKLCRTNFINGYNACVLELSRSIMENFIENER